MSPRCEIEDADAFEAAWDTNRDASNATLQLRQEESTVSELRVPLSTFLIFHASYSHPPAPLRPRMLSFLRAQERKGEESGAGSPQSERAERRYLKHMQRVQLCSGSPLLVGKEGQKVSDNGGLRSAARNPTHDDLCDLGDDDGPPSPSLPALLSFACASFSFALLVADLSVHLASSPETGTREARILSMRMSGSEKYSIQGCRGEITSKFRSALLTLISGILN